MVRTLQIDIGSCHVVRKKNYGLHVTLPALVIFFLKFLVRACKRAITAIRTYGTTGTYVVGYTGRSGTTVPTRRTYHWQDCFRPFWYLLLCLVVEYDYLLAMFVLLYI